MLWTACAKQFAKDGRSIPNEVVAKLSSRAQLYGANTSDDHAADVNSDGKEATKPPPASAAAADPEAGTSGTSADWNAQRVQKLVDALDYCISHVTI